MATVSVQEFAASPEGIVGRAEAGECVVITRDGRPVAEMRPAAPEEPRSPGLPAAPSVPRKAGSAKSQFGMLPVESADSLPADFPEDVPGPRPYGLARGEFVVPPEFFDPLPEDILRGFEGG